MLESSLPLWWIDFNNQPYSFSQLWNQTKLLIYMCMYRLQVSGLLFPFIPISILVSVHLFIFSRILQVTWYPTYRLLFFWAFALLHAMLVRMCHPLYVLNIILLNMLRLKIIFSCWQAVVQCVKLLVLLGVNHIILQSALIQNNGQKYSCCQNIATNKLEEET